MYHCSLSCLEGRHPYISLDNLQFLGDMEKLDDIHRLHLKEQLGLDAKDLLGMEKSQQ